MQNTTHALTQQSASTFQEIMIAVAATLSSAILLIALFSCFYTSKRKQETRNAEKSPLSNHEGTNYYTIRTFDPTANIPPNNDNRVLEL